MRDIFHVLFGRFFVAQGAIQEITTMKSVRELRYEMGDTVDRMRAMIHVADF